MSAQETHLAKNSLWMMLSRFGSQGLAVVFTILLARRLGAEGFGAYVFIAAVIFVANALTTFGTDMLLIREIAAKGNISRLSYALILQLALSILFIALVWRMGASVPNQSAEAQVALKIYSLALIPLAFFTVFTTALRGVQRMDLYSLLSLIVGALQVGIVLWSEVSLVRLSVLLLAAQTIAAIVAGFICSRSIRDFWRSWQFHSLELPSFIREAAPIAFLALMTMLYQRLNLILLSTMVGEAATGLYSAAFRAVEASKTAHLAAFAALYPAMAKNMLWRGAELSEPRRSDLVINEGLAPPRFVCAALSVKGPAMTYLKFLSVAATVFSLLLFLLAKPLVILLYGSDFIASSSVLEILAWVLIPFTINTYLTLAFLASNQEKRVAGALVASLLGLLIFNLWWIPIEGAQGSAWAMLLAECIQLAFLLAAKGSRVLQGEVHEFSKLS